MWSILALGAILAGAALFIINALGAWDKYRSNLDTWSEMKAFVINVVTALGGGGLILIGLRVLVTTILLAAFILIAPSSARAEDNDVRYPVVQPMVMKGKIARHIASRANVEIARPVEVKRSGRKIAKINRGLMGEALSPMLDYRAPLEACGYQVQYGSSGSDPNNADVLIVHSMGTFGALASNSKRVFVIDAPIWASGLKARHSRTMNFPTAFHPRVYGAINVAIPGGHIGAPTQAKRHILAALGCGGKARHAAVR